MEEGHLHGVLEKFGYELTAHDVARAADVIRILFAAKHELRRVPLGILILDGRGSTEQRPYDQVIAAANVRLRQVFNQRREIDEHVVIRLEDKGHLRAVRRHPFQQHDRFQCQIQVGVVEIFLNDITVPVNLNLN